MKTPEAWLFEKALKELPNLTLEEFYSHDFTIGAIWAIELLEEYHKQASQSSVTEEESVICPSEDCNTIMEQCSLNYMCPKCHTMLRNMTIPDNAALSHRPQVSKEEIMEVLKKYVETSSDFFTEGMRYIQEEVYERGKWVNQLESIASELTSKNE